MFGQARGELLLLLMFLGFYFVVLEFLHDWHVAIAYISLIFIYKYIVVNLYKDAIEGSTLQRLIWILRDCIEVLKLKQSEQ